MSRDSVYRSEAARRRIHTLYREAMDRLAIDHETRDLRTPFGRTRVTLAGPVTAPPLLVLHGIHASGPYNLALIRPLVDHFRILSPDVPGQAGMSAERPVPRKNHGYGRWMLAVLDALGADRIAVAGMSFGGAIAMDAAAIAPERLSALVLTVPVGILPIPWFRAARTLAPRWIAYHHRPDEAHLRRAVAPLMDDYEADVAHFFGATLREMHWAAVPPGPFRPPELRAFAHPTLVVGARDDLIAPGARLLPRARRLFSNLETFEVPARHIPSSPHRKTICEKARAFLERAVPGD